MSKILQMYSATIPIEILVIPNPNSNTTIIVGYPSGTETLINNLYIIINIAKITLRKDKIIPNIVTVLIGKYEKLIKESINSFNFFPNVHLDFPCLLEDNE